MVHNTDKKLKLWAGRFRLIKKIIVTLSSCSLLTKHLDSRTGFSKYLGQVEIYIRNEDWKEAKTSLEDSKSVWKKLKPIMQIDIDHDFIKDIEDGFTKLDGYVDTKDKSNSLASILLIEETWENIDSL
jgi:hypothetical protein